MKKAFCFLLSLQWLPLGGSSTTGAQAATVSWRLVALAASIVALSLYSLYRRRIRQILELQTVRCERIARDLHDDIGSTLSNINMLSAITMNKLDIPEEAVRHLKRISEEVSNCSQALDDIIWSANSRNDTLDETIARMRRYYAELFELPGNIDCRLDMDERFTSRKIPMEQRQDIYFIYKESLNNIYKHAAATTASVRVAVEGPRLKLEFTDNGRGFDVTRQSHRNGLKNMRTRVEKWKGRMSVDSNKGHGTKLQICLPIGHPNE